MESLEQGGRTAAGRVIARPQEEGQQLLRAVVDLGGDDQRQVAVLVVVAVKKGQLLLAVRFVVGDVQVENDPPRRRGLVPGHENLERDLGQPVEFAAPDAVFKTRQRRLRGEIGVALGPAPGGHFQDRIGAQPVGVVAVFVTGGDLVNALPEQVVHGMADLAGLARVVQPRGHLGGQAEGSVDLGEQHQPAVGGDVAAVKIADERLPRKESEVQVRNTACHFAESSREMVFA